MEMSWIIYYNDLIRFRGMLQIAFLPLLPCKTMYICSYLTVNLKYICFIYIYLYKKLFFSCDQCCRKIVPPFSVSVFILKMLKKIVNV